MPPDSNAMIKVAVVGGSGDVGRTVVDVLRDDSRYEVIVLGRSVSSPEPAKVELALDLTKASTDSTRDPERSLAQCAISCREL